MRPVDALSRHASSWGWLVTVSAFALLTAGLVMAVWWAATDEERTATYQVRGSVTGITLDIGEADLQIVGGGSQASLQVSHTDRFSFGHPAEADRIVRRGELRLRSRCPNAVPRACSVGYRVVVPDNVPVTVRTTGGAVTFRGYRGSARVTTRSGDIDVAGFCGFSLEARAESGDIDAGAACAPQQLAVRSNEGSVHVTVPPGRYQVEAESASGSEAVSGLDAVAEAPFAIQALSSSGNVSVEGRR